MMYCVIIALVQFNKAKKADSINEKWPEIREEPKTNGNGNGNLMAIEDQ